MLSQSIYTHIFNQDNRFFIYNSRTSLFAEITEEFYEILYNRDYDSLPEYAIEDLKSKGVLCEESEKYLYYSEELVKFNSSACNDSELGLVIVPTTNCNFNCSYCFEGKKRIYVMTDEIQDSVINYIDSNKLATKIHLTWYGGEPLMAFDVTKSLYEKIKGINAKEIISHTLITNGYLIDDKVIEFINYAQIKNIQITLDGNKMHHDNLRYLKFTKKPTFDKILQNINRVLIECPMVKLRIRVNIDKDNSDDFFEIYKYLHENTHSTKLNVYPGFIREDTADKCTLCYKSMSKEKMFQFYISLHNKGVNVSFIAKVAKKRGCIMHQLNSFIIGPRGEMYKCWNDVNNDSKIVSYINNKKIINRKLLYHYLTETHPFSDSNCKDCLHFPICSGGCGWYRSRNVLDKGKFNICPLQKDIRILEESLMLSLDKREVVYPQKISVI